MVFHGKQQEKNGKPLFYPKSQGKSVGFPVFLFFLNENMSFVDSEVIKRREVISLIQSLLE